MPSIATAENGKFEEISGRLGVENYWPWGVSVGDINADGWDDLFITSGMSFPFRYGINSMLLNNQGESLGFSSSFSGLSHGMICMRCGSNWTARRRG